MPSILDDETVVVEAQEEKPRAKRILEPVSPEVEPEYKPRLYFFNKDNGKGELNGKTYHFKKLTPYGAQAFQQWINDQWPNMALAPGKSVGEIMVHGAIRTASWEPLRDLLEWFMLEAVESDGHVLGDYYVMENDEDEMIRFINQFFKASGLTWLEEILKNLASRMEAGRNKAIETVMTAGAVQAVQDQIAE